MNKCETKAIRTNISYNQLVDKIRNIETQREFLKNTIEKTAVRTAEEAVNRVIKAYKDNKLGATKDYYKNTEKILYSYPTLLLQVEQSETFIEGLKNGFVIEDFLGSKSIIRIGGIQCNENAYDVYQERIRLKEESLERTKAEIVWIELALQNIKNDEHLEIINMKYFENIAISEIAEKMNMSERSVWRKKNMLINKLSVFLFGVDACK